MLDQILWQLHQELLISVEDRDGLERARPTNDGTEVYLWIGPMKSPEEEISND